MRVRLLWPSAAAALAVLVLSPLSHADPDRSAAIKQVTRGETLAERSSASFDQIATAATARRGAVEQLDPSLPDGSYLEDDAANLTGAQGAGIAPACVLSPEQQAIVTSLQSQGRLAAGECEMLAWFAQPGDPVEGDERRSLAEAVIVTSPELLGQESEADRQARLEADRAAAEAAAAAREIAATILMPVPPGN
jgi:hypothetical protein